MHGVSPNLGYAEDTFTPSVELGAPMILAHAPHEPTGLVQVVTRWAPTDAERRRLAEGEDVYVVFVCDGTVALHDVRVGAETVRKAPDMHGPPVVEVTRKELPL